MALHSSLRRAAVNKGLIITLVVVIIAASGFWIWHFATSEKTVGYDPASDKREFALVCSSCKQRSTVTALELKNMPRSEDGTQFECPKCKKITGSVQRPGGTSLTSP